MDLRIPLFAMLLALGLAPPSATADALDAQRLAFPAALEAARSGPPGRWQALASELEDYPLAPWLPYSALVRDLPRAAPRDVEAFLAAHDGSLPADLLRTRWLRHLATRREWPRFVATWRPQDDVALQCRHGEARIATGATTGLAAELRAIWLRGDSLPPDCDPMIAWLRAQGALDKDTVWQRLELAAIARNAGLMRSLATYLPAAAAPEALRYANLAADAAGQLPKAAAWADTPRARRHVSIAVAQLARRDHVAGASRWNALEPRFAFDDADRARAIGQIALQKAASYDPAAASWFARLPDDGADDTVRDWRVREALSRADWKAATTALGALSATQQLDGRYRWLRGRILEIEGQPEAAEAVWDSLAGEANFHGFLAADRLQRAYRICPETPSTDAALRAKVAGDPGLRRAFEWLAIDRHDQARREWAHTLARLDAAARPVAVELAHARGWIDRGPLTLLRPDEVRQYALRFPLGHRGEVDTHARRLKLDPGLVNGLIRAESAWMEDARSGADARGLMQMLPSTAKPLARRERLAYSGPNDLYRPPLAIALGTRYLADELDRWDGRVHAATAAYNAGPAPVIRWLKARGELPSDLWIETVPYRETREYIARVVAFATLYDWRLGKDVMRVSTRIGLPAPIAAAAAVACEPAPTPTPTPTSKVSSP
jgi:soluble lytic murein transglycosylase